MRGRNNNNNNNNGSRRGPNPLSRPYESNGPDVKVRGTAQHIAEKYLQLARDAQSSGDHVMSENYLQHAEHYFRIVLAAQELLAEQTGQQFPPQRQFGEEEGEEGEDGDANGNPGAPQQQGYGQGERQQGRNEPRHQDNRNADSRFDNRQERQDRPQYDRNQDRQQDGGERPRNENRGDQGYRGERPDNRNEGRGEFRQDRYQQDRPQQDRPERQDRPQQDRPQQDRNERFERRPRFDRDRPERNDRNDSRPQQGSFDPANEPQPAVTVEPRFKPRHAEPEDETGGLPAFVTAPVPRQVINATAPEPEAHDDLGGDEAPAAAPRKRGRPRKDRSEAGPVEG
jgi:hypothetical protein